MLFIITCLQFEWSLKSFILSVKIELNYIFEFSWNWIENEFIYNLPKKRQNSNVKILKNIQTTTWLILGWITFPLKDVFCGKRGSWFMTSSPKNESWLFLDLGYSWIKIESTNITTVASSNNCLNLSNISP